MDIQVPPVPIQPNIFPFLQRSFSLKMLEQRSVLSSWFNIRPWLYYHKAKDLTLCHRQKKSLRKVVQPKIQMKPVLKNASVHGVYRFENTTQGSVLKVLCQTPVETYFVCQRNILKKKSENCD